MNYLHVIDIASNGGAEVHARRLACQQAKMAIFTHFIFPISPFQDAFKKIEKDGVVCMPLDFKQSLFNVVAHIRKYIIDHKIDVVHSHHFKSDFYVTLATIGLKTPKRLITVHYLFRDFIKCVKSPIRILKIFIVSAVAYHRATRIFVLSRPARDSNRRWFCLGSKKLCIMPNAIDPEEMILDPEKQKQISSIIRKDPRVKIIACAGALIERKGQHLLVEAVGRYLKDQPFILLLIGPDEGLKDKILELVSKYGIESKILIVGYQSDVKNWISLCDVYVQPSLSDNMPNTILEAMCLRRPVIVSDIRNMADNIIHGKTGYLVNVNSPEKISDAILAIVRDEALSKRLSEGGYTYLQENWTMRSLVNNIVNIL